MKKKREDLNGVYQTRMANLSSVSKKEDGTLSFIIVSKDGGGVRFDWSSGSEYEEVLDIKGANTEKLNTFFKDHKRGVDDAIGQITNTYQDKGELIADVKFDEDGLSVKRKYENGTLQDVSIGYKIKSYERTERENNIDLITVTDFEILELSAVGIGFDSGAKITGRESIFKKGDEMKIKELQTRLAELEKVAERTADENSELEKVRKEIMKERASETEHLRLENIELVRKSEIMQIASQHNPSIELRAKFEREGSVVDFTRAILDEKSKKQPTFSAQVKDESTRESMLSAMGDAISLNAGVRIKDAHKDADMFRGATLIDMAKAITTSSSFDKNEIASRAMVSDDFPVLLSNIGNKILSQGYNGEQSSYQTWVKEVDVNDFKINTDITLDTTGRLQKLNEYGEIKEGQISESAEEWKIESFAKEFVITRKMIINDNLGAFNNYLSDFGQMAKRTANGIVYDILQSKNDYASYTMKDGIPIFNAAHKNLSSSGTALSATSLEAARTKMMRQASKNGDAFNIIPRFLMVAPEQEILALTIINSTGSTTDNKNSGVVNPFQNSMTVIVDSELEAGAWYLAGGSRTIKAGYLAGTGRRPIVQVDNKSLTKTTFQGVFDFGVVAEDFRSLYKNTGA